MVSMIRAESLEFLPLVLLYCWIGWMALSRMTGFQLPICDDVQLP